MKTAHRNALVLVLMVFATTVASGCTRVNAWQRGKLAHPTMKPGSPVGMAERHVHDIQEGAIGGTDLEGGGCGCN